ncbi:hypothetical protein N431DRAFT_71734 [Stipitochalara longipes BDJ]|nr:hypothetical protein N431DRAFT_71734 [Stipitochalara longipes BDJ]
MKFTPSILAALLSCAATNALFRSPRPFHLNSPEILPRQASATLSSAPSSFPSLSLTIPSGTAFTSPTGAPHHSSHGTRPPRPSASHHSAGGRPPRPSKSGNVPRQYPSITASSFGSISTSASPLNGTRGTSVGGGPTAGRHSTTRGSRTTHTVPFPSGTGTASLPFPTGSAAPSTFSTSVLTIAA